MLGWLLSVRHFQCGGLGLARGISFNWSKREWDFLIWEEIRVYKDVEPTNRLLVLKALCEVCADIFMKNLIFFYSSCRLKFFDAIFSDNCMVFMLALQYDTGSYINDAIKNGSAVSEFRKGKLAGDENRISFWCDGNETMS